MAASPAKIYPVESPFYRDLRDLYISQGYSLPSTAGPWSRDELLFLLNKLEQSRFSDIEQQLFDSLRSELTNTQQAFSVGFEANLESYTHINTDSFTTEEDWVYSYLDRKPMINVPLELDLGPFYAGGDIALVNSPFDDRDDSHEAVDGTSDLFGTFAFTTNLPVQAGSDKLYLDSNVPYRGFLAAGGSGWHLQVGRDRLSWGPGASGNFMLGSQVQYHNQGRVTAYRDSFKYTFVTSFFPHPDEIGAHTSPYTQSHAIIGLKLFMAHRFEWRFLHDRLGFALNEGIMYQSASGGIDLRILNPFMVYHNYFVRQNANSLASLEVDYALAKGWNLYGQFALDEIALGEDEWNLSTASKHPNGLAFMLGLRMAKPVENGLLTGHLEGVYTDPYLYLRSLDGDDSQTVGDHTDSLNYIIALRRWFPDKVVYDQDYLGYRYGGDALVLSSSLEYREPDAWYLGGRFFGMAHGEIDKNSLWIKGDLDPAPTGSPTFYLMGGVAGGMNKDSWDFYGSL
ncbi:MAG: hypothetical protein PHO72_09745, partial [Sphaerochaeta sp.]|nr:hypothetical protein [Sphaerochaeta sp.]